MPHLNSAAMLDCQAASNSSKEGDTISCKHCQATGDNQVYWGIQLDQDLLETIVSIYPEWFKDYNLNLTAMEDGSLNIGTDDVKMVVPLLQASDIHSPSKAEVDDVSLQKSMDKNKESLKVKLMLRRPINQLVDQGIMPPLKTPPAFHEQRQKLERAKMGDILKSKIQRRPDRQELIQQHILEDTTVDPSLQDKQRQLKKARLADGLNDRLSQRPGPLELIKGNILQTDEMFTLALKEGQIMFKKTSEGQFQKHLPSRYSLDEDSGSDGTFSPSPPYDFSEHSQSSLPSLEASESSPTSLHESPRSTGTSFSLSPSSSVSSPPPSAPSLVYSHSQESGTETHSIPLQTQNKENGSKNRKKPKPKAQPKTRTIKFHEYKGPPNAQKNQTLTPPASVETSYDLLLQQQQLLLQWQLELQQKYPQVILPSGQFGGDQTSQIGPSNNSSNQQPQGQESVPVSPQKLVAKLEDMKVTDLKAELKKRNLPVSGSKPQLIERLKPFSELPHSLLSNCVSQTIAETLVSGSSTNTSLPVNVGGILLDAFPSYTHQTEEISPSSPSSGNNSSGSSLSHQSSVDSTAGLFKVLSNSQTCGSRPSSAVPMEVDSGSINAPEMMDTSDAGSSPVNDDFMKLQLKKIEELQQELHKSQMQQIHLNQSLLQQQQQHSLQQNFFPSVTVPVTFGHVSSSISTLANSGLTSTATPTTTTITTASTASTSAATTTIHGVPVDSKTLQRQILQHHLQLKVLQHQQQQQQQKQLQQQKQGTSTANSTAVHATLTALLQNRHPLTTTSNGLSSNTTTTQSLTLASPTVVTTHVLTSAPLPTLSHTKSLPLPQSLLVSSNHAASPSNSSSDSPITISLPNGIAHQRTTSLPSFSALLGTKPAPVRNNTEPQFVLTKPPPNYDEATKQLNKAKKQENTTRPFNSQAKRCKSIKSQAVDDVLEILIKNGELPPSAAQEPPTPTTPETTKNGQSPLHPLFSQTSNAVTETVQETTAPSHPLSSALSSTSNSIPPSSSLQSMLGSNALSASSLVDNDGNIASSLDFDFHLDAEDIEAMDLGVLTQEEEEPMSSVPIKAEPASLPINCQNLSSLNFNQISNSSLSQTNTFMNNSDLNDFSDTGMDTFLSEWIDSVMASSSFPEPPQQNTVSTLPQPHFSSISNEHDPLLSNLSNMHETLDEFALDDSDLKTPDLYVLSWDKGDFAT